MRVGIDPKVDYAFKHLFGRDATRPLLMHLADAVLQPGPGHAIAEVELLNPFNPKETEEDKLSVLDVKARDQSGRQLNLEMQMLAFRHYEKRILYYWGKFHTQQLHAGQDYLLLRPTLSLSFLDHVLYPAAAGYHHRFRLLEVGQHFPFGDDLEVHILELPKFIKAAHELTSDLDKWLYFLRHAENMDAEALPEAFTDPVFIRAIQELQMLTQTDLERERYEARRKFQLDYNTGIKVARLEGREEGLQQGLEQGREQGQRIGTIHLCQRLLGRPLTPAEELANLSLEELAQLAERLQAEALQGR